MVKFPVDAPIGRVLKTLERLGFRRMREGNHIALERDNADGSKTPLTMPNHKTLKRSTLRTILTQVRVSREQFLEAYEET